MLSNCLGGNDAKGAAGPWVLLTAVYCRNPHGTGEALSKAGVRGTLLQNHPREVAP